MAPEFYVIRTFFYSFFLGVGLFFLFYKIKGPEYFRTHQDSKCIPNSIHFQYKTENIVRLKQYDDWFNQSGLKKKVLNSDTLRYTNINGVIESDYLYKKITVMCAVFSANPKYKKAINETWATSCNEVLFYSRHRENGLTSKVGNKFNTTSSFHLLCDVIRRIVVDYPEIQWAIFVKDDMFVITENLRYLVAPLNHEEGHYLGHAINFWGVEYNIALSGFVLSRGAMKKFVGLFTNSSSCSTGGKYWKQEDLYLGKHLKTTGVQPVDTRDKHNYTSFIGYDLDKMMFPGSVQYFTTYNTRALYPVKCCGPHMITFPVLGSAGMYTYYYMIYTMRIFESGNHGNIPAPTSIPDHQVWQEFLISEGLPLNISSSRYQEIWFQKIGSVNIVIPNKKGNLK